MHERKTAIVTGSATGVGAATALLLAQRGYDVLINYSKSEREARESEAACRAAGADTLLVQGDVADDAACRALAKPPSRAGSASMRSSTTPASPPSRAAATGTRWMPRCSSTSWVSTCSAPSRWCALVRRTCRPARGAIVNVSSIAGALGIGSSVPYIASKGAVNSMTLHFARTLAPHVRVNAVCPGLITTRWFVDGMGQENYEKIKANYEQTTPLQTAASAEDVADAVVWLIDGARTTTGELLMLDGGRHLGGTQAVPSRG